MRDLHERLAALRLGADRVVDDRFDRRTVALVEAFQRSRGLPVTGEVDATTWERLIEAGWHLGDRLLYEATPALRGDDVAELQVILAQLGFNPGRIDGIFGPLLFHALADFQRNRGLEPDGTLTKATWVELQRLRVAVDDRHLVNEARERVAPLPVAGQVLISGNGPLFDALTVGERPHRVTVRTDDERDAIDRANELDVALVVDVRPADVVGLRLHYWSSYRSYSRLGERITSQLASALAHAPSAPRVEITGMALPILRETRMVSVAVAHGELSENEVSDAVAAIEGQIASVIHRSDV